MVNSTNTYFGSEGCGLFAPGFLVGVRSWRISPDGNLRGIYYNQDWKVGPNVAACLKHNSFYFYGYYGSPHMDEPPPVPPTHTFADCRCGFYGYFDGSNDFYTPGYVTGVIRGYGEVIIGTKGFRAMKADILALHIPPVIKDPDRIVDAYHEIPQFATFDEMVAAYPCTDPTEEVTKPDAQGSK